MRRAIPAIVLVVCGAVLLLSGAADPQQPQRPNQQPHSDCTIGSTEERLECLGSELARQRVEILMLRFELESLRSPKVVPLLDRIR